MTSLLERAIEKARSLPADVQDDLARMMFQVVGEPQPVVDLTAEEEQAALRSREAAARGEFATQDQLRAIWAKYGL